MCVDYLFCKSLYKQKYIMKDINVNNNMLMPPLQGQFKQKSFFIYAACDTMYFDEFGRSIIRSIRQNSNTGIHIHLYNPTTEQIDYCIGQPQVSVTYEYVPLALFESAAAAITAGSADPAHADQLKRTLTAMSKSNDQSIQQRCQRTYFASARFVRLNEIMPVDATLLAIDSDAIVRANIPGLADQKDFYIHHITGKKARFLAGGIYLTGSKKGHEFMTQYAAALKSCIESDHLYWGVDQDVLNSIVPGYNFGNLPKEYIDWEMQPCSYIWTAKGMRKELTIFINEQKKYSV